MLADTFISRTRNGLLLAALFGASVAPSSCATGGLCLTATRLDLTQLSLEELLQLEVVRAGGNARRCAEEQLS